MHKMLKAPQTLFLKLDFVPDYRLHDQFLLNFYLITSYHKSHVGRNLQRSTDKGQAYRVKKEIVLRHVLYAVKTKEIGHYMQKTGPIMLQNTWRKLQNH